MKKKIIDVEGMIKGGPYSQAVEAGGWLYLSGVVPIDAEREIFITDDIKAATALVLENLQKVLQAADAGMENVVKATVFLKDMNDFKAMNEVYGTYFPENRPARTCVAVRELPGNFQVEIELVAFKG